MVQFSKGLGRVEGRETLADEAAGPDGASNKKLRDAGRPNHRADRVEEVALSRSFAGRERRPLRRVGSRRRCAVEDGFTASVAPFCFS